MKEPLEDRGALDLTFLIEEHQRQIWEYKQKESEWIKTDNILQGSKKIIDELSTKLVGLARSRGPWSVVLEYFSNIHVPWFPDQGACYFRLEA
jgi:hypothetical protein